MEEMLRGLAIEDDSAELRGPTQMHNLLELIKKEQNIYNIIFHELIRQVMDFDIKCFFWQTGTCMLNHTASQIDLQFVKGI